MNENAPDLVMVNPTAGLDGTHLLSYIQRIEKLMKDADDIAADIKDIYQEAKMSGFDKKYIRELIKLRKLDPDELTEQDELIAMYRQAAGL